jgi:phage tail tape-measure protein
MPRKRKTQYAKKAKRQGFMQGFSSELKTKGNVKNTALETGKDILVCVLGGGLIGAAIGRPSLAVGILTTGVGHYSGNKLTQLLGLGMMAANGFQRNTTVSGIEGLDGVKERVQAFKESFSERLYLDKLKKSASTGTTNGFGDLQYFSYPNNDLAALDAIEDQLTDSAMQFQGQLPEAEYDMGDIGDLDCHLF